MKIEIAKSAGFCFGVNRALNIANDLIGENNVYTLGPIIHNKYVVNDLKEKGINVYENISDIKSGDTVIIRSHGVSLDVFEKINQLNAKIVDATCPFVQKIQQIVLKASQDGKIVMIAGEPTHPEVVGIKGHCLGECYVFRNSDELKTIAQEHPELDKKEVVVVAQTTFSVAEWKKSMEIIKKLYTKSEIFDTICNATSKRQEEAECLSKKADLMIVIGGRDSSNTAKLRDICQKNCETYLIENADELPVSELKKVKSVAVTAGASAPANIIEEAVNRMTELTNEVQSDKESGETELGFEAMLEESLKKLNTGSKVHGTVMSITPNEVYVDVGRKQSGIIPRNELCDDINVDPADVVKVGDELDLYVMRVNDQEGTITLSKKKLDKEKAFDKMIEAKDNNEQIKGVVTEILKNGIIVSSDSIKVFIPKSLINSYNNQFIIDDLLGKEMPFKVLEIDKFRNRIVGSIKDAILEETQKKADEFWKTAKIGDVHKGIVSSIKPYGAFINLGMVNGLLHISEISWKKVNDVSDFFKVGDEIEVSISSLDRENHKIGLSYKKEEDNPWEILKRTHQEGDIIESYVSGMNEYGVFVPVVDGIEGFVHISEISPKRISTIKGVLSKGEKVSAKILTIDYDEKRVKLSIKQAIKDDIINELSTSSAND